MGSQVAIYWPSCNRSIVDRCLWKWIEY